MALIVMHVANTLAHCEPTLRLGTVSMPTFPVNLERSGLIDTGKRRPSLQTNVYEPQLFIDKVVIQDALRHFRGYEVGPTVAICQLESRTNFPDAEYADQTLYDRVQPQLLFGPGIFVDATRKILIGPFVFDGVVLGMIHQTVRPFRTDTLQKLISANLQLVVHKAFELRFPTDRQMPLEDHSIETGQNPRNEAGKMVGETRY